MMDKISIRWRRKGSEGRRAEKTNVEHLLGTRIYADCHGSEAIAQKKACLSQSRRESRLFSGLRPVRAGDHFQIPGEMMMLAARFHGIIIVTGWSWFHLTPWILESLNPFLQSERRMIQNNSKPLAEPQRSQRDQGFCGLRPIQTGIIRF